MYYWNLTRLTLAGMLTAASVFIAPMAAKGQFVLNGLITDQTDGLPVPGVAIKIEGAFSTAVSDSKGNFRFEQLKDSIVVLTTSHVSYQPDTVRVTLPSKTVTIALQPKTYLSEEVNITATRADRRSAFAYSSMDRQEIEKVNLAQDIPLLLQFQPSVISTSDAGNGVGYSGIRIRGSDATRVNVTINGIPVNDAESHQVYWVNMPDLAASVDNLQLQRGVGTSTNGAGAFGGSLNIQTTTLSADPHVEYSGSAGSFNTFRNSLQFGTGLLKNKFSLDGRLSLITSDGYIDRATSNLRSLYFSGGYYGDKQTLRAVVFSGKEKTYQAWYGVPQDSLENNRTFNPAGLYYGTNGSINYYDNQTDNYQQDNYQLIYSREFGNNWTLNTALHYTKGRGYYEEYVQGADYADYGLPGSTVGDSVISESDLVRQRWLDNDFYGMTWSLQHSADRLLLMFGGAVNQYKGDHYGEVISGLLLNPVSMPYRYYDDKATKNDINAYGKIQYDAGHGLTLMGDVQLRHVAYSFTGLDSNRQSLPDDVSLTFFNPKAGITWEPNTLHRFYASVSVGQKEPVRDDYIASTTNSRPEPEKLVDYEAGYGYTGSNFTFGANLYFMNYIRQLILTGQINDVGEQVRQSIGKSYRAGIELTLNWRPVKSWSFGMNTTLSRNRIKSYPDYIMNYNTNSVVLHETYENTPIAFSPDYTGALMIVYKPLESVSMTLAGKYVGKQFLDNTANASKQIDAYFTQDLRLEWTPKVRNVRKLGFHAIIYNLSNLKYSSNGYTYSYIYGGESYTENYFYPQAPINFMAGVVVGF